MPSRTAANLHGRLLYGLSLRQPSLISLAYYAYGQTTPGSAAYLMISIVSPQRSTNVLDATFDALALHGDPADRTGFHRLVSPHLHPEQGSGRSSPAADIPANSNNLIHKELAFLRNWSATVVASRARQRSGILPRRLERHCGASVVRPDGRSEPKEIPMIQAQAKRQITARSKRQKTTDPGARDAALTRSKAKAPTRRPAGQRQQTPERRDDGKQAQVLAILQTPSGATIEKIAAMTGWQHHSVRGFFAAVIRKRLGLNLVSETSAKGRVYRVVDRPASLPGSVETNKPV
jgi:Protein of unknown function (DUF3489)